MEYFIDFIVITSLITFIIANLVCALNKKESILQRIMNLTAAFVCAYMFVEFVNKLPL